MASSQTYHTSTKTTRFSCEHNKNKSQRNDLTPMFSFQQAESQQYVFSFILSNMLLHENDHGDNL